MIAARLVDPGTTIRHSGTVAVLEAAGGDITRAAFNHCRAADSPTARSPSPEAGARRSSAALRTSAASLVGRARPSSRGIPWRTVITAAERPAMPIKGRSAPPCARATAAGGPRAGPPTPCNRRHQPCVYPGRSWGCLGAVRPFVSASAPGTLLGGEAWGGAFHHRRGPHKIQTLGYLRGWTPGTQARSCTIDCGCAFLSSVAGENCSRDGLPVLRRAASAVHFGCRGRWRGAVSGPRRLQQQAQS